MNDDFLTGFIEGLIAKPLYVGDIGNDGLVGQMIAFFTGVTLDAVCAIPIFEQG